MPTTELFWSTCLSTFERELSAQQFNTWIKPLRLEGDDEGLQVLASMGAGAIANVKVGNVQLGPALNFLLGAAAKVAIVSDVDSVPLRVLAQTGKTLLHTQLGIWTRDALRGVP